VTRMITDNPIQLLDVTGDYQPSAEDLAWARGLVEDPCAGQPGWSAPAPAMQAAPRTQAAPPAPPAPPSPAMPPAPPAVADAG
jgi:hypothetical protein